MKKLKHKGSCDDTHKDVTHEEWEGLQHNEDEEELDELVDFDGALLNSKIPLGINKTNKVSRSTSDDVVKTGAQKGSGYGYYYKRYWGESVERNEAYVGPAVGEVEDFDLMTADEVVQDLEDRGYSEDKAKHKASVDYGKDLENPDETEFLIKDNSRKKMRDVLEVIVDKKTKDNGLQSDGEMDLYSANPILDKMGKKFKEACKADGINPIDYFKNLK
tara:strand:+ start:18025 stop:18678 length:654 start_codon:yes stop_codon:yes gene_type:complete